MAAYRANMLYVVHDNLLQIFPSHAAMLAINTDKNLTYCLGARNTSWERDTISCARHIVPRSPKMPSGAYELIFFPSPTQYMSNTMAISTI